MSFMEDSDSPPLFRPLLSKTTTTTVDDYHLDQTNPNPSFSSNSSIILRLLCILSIGSISIWANHEASKGFDIKIVNDANATPNGKRFSLLYISDDKASRILLNTSSFVQNLLHDKNQDHAKKIQQVTLHLTTRIPPGRVTVDRRPGNGFVIGMNPDVIAGDSDGSAVVSMILQGMARVWLWGNSGFSRAPSWIIDGMVECINWLAGFGPIGKDLGGDSICRRRRDYYKDAKAVAEILYYGERYEEGFLRRLDRGLRDGWCVDDRTVEDALRGWAENVCDSYKISSRYFASY